jgi:hypothetical protein
MQLRVLEGHLVKPSQDRVVGNPASRVRAEGVGLV